MTRGLLRRRGRRVDEPGLLGRDEQLRVLQELLGRLPEAGGALVLKGRPGVGKSALLRVAAERARTAGWETLEVAGHRDDTPFSGLRGLLRPVLGTADALPAGQVGILRSALETGSGPRPETFKVALAAFNLLTMRAAERPAVLIVDDVQWLDEPTRTYWRSWRAGRATTRSSSSGHSEGHGTGRVRPYWTYRRWTSPRHGGCWPAMRPRCLPSSGSGCWGRHSATRSPWSNSPQRGTSWGSPVRGPICR